MNVFKGIKAIFTSKANDSIKNRISSDSAAAKQYIQGEIDKLNKHLKSICIEQAQLKSVEADTQEQVKQHTSILNGLEKDLRSSDVKDQRKAREAFRIKVLLGKKQDFLARIQTQIDSWEESKSSILAKIDELKFERSRISAGISINNFRGVNVDVDEFIKELSTVVEGASKYYDVIEPKDGYDSEEFAKYLESLNG
jgi:hypothetical protein|nr:MAG TPA: shock protein A [Herelleviridae sp.]